MIRTKREYDVTTEQAARFRAALSALQSGGELVDIQAAAMRSQLEDLEAELREYDERVAESLR